MPHHRRSPSHKNCVGGIHPARCLRRFVLATLVLACGCTAPLARPASIAASELAAAQPTTSQLVARLRVLPNQPLPEALCQTLCREFVLVTVKNSSEWAQLGRCVALPSLDRQYDMSRGLIVGVLALVGERAEPGWPIHLQTVRNHRGMGKIDAIFAPGFYYPLETAGYLELVYVPGLQAVGMVSVNHRSFVVRSDVIMD